MKKILLIITGSIAAYKSLDLIRLLKKQNYDLEIILTKAAAEFITPLLVSSILGKEVHQNLFSLTQESKMGHIKLARDSDLILIAPASADIISKMNYGLADDLASTVLLAANKPIFIAPAMNEKMWLNIKTQENIAKLRQNNIKILDPKTDILACGEYGAGKMTDIEEIFSKIENFFNNKKLLSGKKAIITTGATYESIDPVRFIGNYSSGKQGIKIAEKLDEVGADVTLIAANVKENINLNSKNIIRVKNSAEMFEAVNNNIKNSDIFISVAAVSDFKPKNYSIEKIKKEQGDFNKIELVKNIDILKTIANSKDRPKFVVGFAAESKNVQENAKKKLEEKNCDLIIANDISDGGVFGSNYNKITILSNDAKAKIFDKLSKSEVADGIVEEIIKRIT